MADIPSDTTSTTTFEGNPLTGASFSGELESYSDVDWIKVTLVAGKTYDIYAGDATTGAGRGNSTLKIYDSAGTLLATDEDDGTGANSLLHFTASATEVYFIAVSDHDGWAGQYTVTMAQEPKFDFQIPGWPQNVFKEIQGTDGTDIFNAETVYLENSSAHRVAAARLLGGKGDDTIDMSDMDPTVVLDALGEQGDDTITAGANSQFLSGGLGNDTIYGGSRSETLFGDAGDDLVYGGEGGDWIFGGAGSDFLSGDGGPVRGAGNDMIRGGAGLDYIEGGDGDDTLWGDSGDDRLYGDNSPYSGSGGTGADTLNGGTGADIMVGGAGNDTYYVDNAGDIVDETGTNGTDKIYSSITVSLANAAHVKGAVEALVLTGSANIAGTGNALANAITGNAGGNVLNGAAGNDSLDGRAGNDKLTGGAGADRLTGGTGADSFIFASIADSTPAGSGRDVILDFSHAQADRIDLRLIDADTTASGNQAFHVIGTAAFGHHAGELRAVASGGNLSISGDTNGDGAADFQVLLHGVASILAADFVL